MADWQPIETAPRDVRVDLWAKHWRYDTDTFMHQRFPDCSWHERLDNTPAGWYGLGSGWHATHWMPLPGAPAAAHPGEGR